MGTDFIWRPTEDAVKVKDRTGFERYVKEHNEFFSENLVSTDEHRTTVKSTPDEEVVSSFAVSRFHTRIRTLLGSTITESAILTHENRRFKIIWRASADT